MNVSPFTETYTALKQLQILRMISFRRNKTLNF